jgi:hypothetical protein
MHIKTTAERRADEVWLTVVDAESPDAEALATAQWETAMAEAQKEREAMAWEAINDAMALLTTTVGRLIADMPLEIQSRHAAVIEEQQKYMSVLAGDRL